MKLALIQMMVTSDKKNNIAKAVSMIEEAAGNGADMAILPEMFNCPYETEKFLLYAEAAGEEACRSLSEAAVKNGIYIVGGSIPERKSDRLYNTCFIYNDRGEMIGHYSKSHLFDIDIKGGQYFKESDTFTPGNDICVFEAKGHKFAVAICFDIRFSDYFRRLTMEGAECIVVPAAFNMTTGPMHWELAFRSRAVDNQLYTVGVAPARDETGKYVSYANSLICDPWGRVVACAGTDEKILYGELDLDLVQSVRAQLPILSARREELY